MARASIVLAPLALGGCAERGLVSRPGTPTGTGTWVAVWLAAGLAAALIGVLLTLPAWRASSGPRFAPALLALQTGAVAVAGLVLAGAAARGWELSSRPLDQAPAGSLLRLSRVDGDGSFLALMVLVVALLTVGLVALLATAAQLARADDPFGRWLATVLLCLQLGGCATALVLLLTGGHGWPFLGPALATPLIAAAVATSWPTTRT